MRRLCLLVLMIGLPACSNDETFDPTGPTGPTIPSIGGSFTSPNLYHFELTGGRNLTLDCGGALTIGTQIATSFTGSFVLSDSRCLSGSLTGTISGTFTTAGAISFGMALGDANFLTAGFNCTYVSGDQVLTGTLIGPDLQAEARTVMTCPTFGTVSLFTRVAGSR